MAKTYNLSDWVGDTWVVDVSGLTSQGSPVDLSGATVEGRLAGVAISSFVLDPEPGVEVRVVVNAAATELVTPSTSPIPSRITLLLANGQEKSIVFGFQPKERP